MAPIPDDAKEDLLKELLTRPRYMTEVRRDGKDDKVVAKVIKEEFERRLALPDAKESKFERR